MKKILNVIKKKYPYLFSSFGMKLKLLRIINNILVWFPYKLGLLSYEKAMVIDCKSLEIVTGYNPLIESSFKKWFENRLKMYKGRKNNKTKLCVKK